MVIGKPHHGAGLSELSGSGETATSYLRVPVPAITTCREVVAQMKNCMIRSEHRHGFNLAQFQLIEAVEVFVANKFLFDHVS